MDIASTVSLFIFLCINKQTSESAKEKEEQPNTNIPNSRWLSGSRMCTTYYTTKKVPKIFHYLDCVLASIPPCFFLFRPFFLMLHRTKMLRAVTTVGGGPPRRAEGECQTKWYCKIGVTQRWCSSLCISVSTLLAIYNYGAVIRGHALGRNFTSLFTLPYI